jgi:hypothetical protein
MSYSFGADTEGQFKDITSFLPKKQGGSSMWGVLGAGALNAGASIYTANLAAKSARDSDNTSRRIGQGTFDAQLAGILESRELNKGNLAGSIWDATSAATWRPDLAFGRSKAAALFQAGPLASLEAANKRDFSRAFSGMEGSLENKEFEQRRRRGEVAAAYQARNDALTGLMGEIAPPTLFR